MQERVFKLTPLTPVHIGTGETITPEEYFIAQDQLVRINTHRILMEWPEASRRRFEQLIAANDLWRARSMLHEAGRDGRYQLYREPVGKAALREIQRADPTQRRGEVHVFQRNLPAGKVIVPGSSIKGAMRTAILNSFVAEMSEEAKQLVRERLRQERREHPREQRAERLREDRARAWMKLEELALNYRREQTECDPLRMLRVADAELPASAVRVDRVMVLNRQPQQPQQRGIQLHVERLLSLADGASAPACQVRIALAFEAMRGCDPRPRTFKWRDLITACNEFFMNRYKQEIASFAFLGSRPWVPAQLPEGAILLRIGRFSHFESLSVDGLRSGWNQQRRRPIEGMGSSRSVCMLNEERPAPFGWVLLAPV